MQSESSVTNADDQGAADSRGQTLKEFKSAGRGFWSDVSDADWNDWHWQLKHRITTVEQLEALMTLTADEKAGCAHANQKLALAITPYFFNLIDRDDPDCPIRKQVIPRAGELVVSEGEMLVDEVVERGKRMAPVLRSRLTDFTVTLARRYPPDFRRVDRNEVIEGLLEVIELGETERE